MKANPQQAILRYFLGRGCGLEIASAGELQQALAAGGDPERMVFAGPGKTDDELRLALHTGLGEIHVESLGEIRRLAFLATDSQRSARIALRINPSLASATGSLQMGGRPSQFGISEDQLEAAVGLAERASSLDLIGLHLNTGTQLLDAELLLAYYQYALTLTRRVAAQLGRPLATLDFGGGLGIPYYPGQGTLAMDRVAEGLRQLVAECDLDPELAAMRLLIEPGRYLVGEAGIYLTRVVDLKQSQGQDFVVLNGGLHQHLAATGNFGQTLKRFFPLAAVTRLDDALACQATVVGPLCTPLDTLGKAIALPALQVGDLVAVFQSGAYARAASPLQFLGHPSPPEVMVSGAQATLIRRRGGWQDELRDQLPLTPEAGGGQRAEQGGSSFLG